MEIIWFDSAISSLYDILKYITKKFGTQTAIRVKSKIDDSIRRLSLCPKSGKLIYTKTTGEEIRSWVINQNKVFYVLTKTKIILFLVWDNRRDPELLDRILLSELNIER